MNEQRLKDWMAGSLPDSELTVDEVAWLEEAVFEAVSRKLAAAEPPETVQ